MTPATTLTPRPTPAGPDGARHAGVSRAHAGASPPPSRQTPDTTAAATTTTDGGGGGDGAELTSQLRLSVGRLYRSLRLYGHITADTVPVCLLSALDTLHHRGELTPGQLAAAEHIRPASTTRIINTLARAGLISRQDHPSDRRQALLRITPAGIELLTDETTARERWLDQRLATLTEQQRQTLTHAAHIFTTLAGVPQPDRGEHQLQESST